MGHQLGRDGAWVGLLEALSLLIGLLKVVDGCSWGGRRLVIDCRVAEGCYMQCCTCACA